jgi:hypothetical protein
LRKTSIHAPAATLSGLNFDSRASARSSPKAIENAIAMTAISRFTRKPSRMKRALLPVTSHSQLSGSNR